jgi:hypothetical protein
LAKCCLLCCYFYSGIAPHPLQKPLSVRPDPKISTTRVCPKGWILSTEYKNGGSNRGPSPSGMISPLWDKIHPWMSHLGPRSEIKKGLGCKAALWLRNWPNQEPILRFLNLQLQRQRCIRLERFSK